MGFIGTLKKPRALTQPQTVKENLEIAVFGHFDPFLYSMSNLLRVI